MRYNMWVLAVCGISIVEGGILIDDVAGLGKGKGAKREGERTREPKVFGQNPRRRVKKRRRETAADRLRVPP